MFVREKRINGYTYLYLVETVREDGRAKQRIIKNLGRKEALATSGALERLASSVARYAERALVLSQIEAGNPESPAEKKVSNFKMLCLTSLVWKLQSWQASGAKRFHGKPPLIGLGVHRRSGGGRVQTFAIIRFLFGRALIITSTFPPIAADSSSSAAA